MHQDGAHDTSVFARIMRKSVEEPFVTVGALATCGALLSAVYHLRRGNKAAGNTMLHYRVLAQGITILALVGYGFMEHQKKKQKALEESIGQQTPAPPKYQWKDE